MGDPVAEVIRLLTANMDAYATRRALKRYIKTLPEKEQADIRRIADRLTELRLRGPIDGDP